MTAMVWYTTTTSSLEEAEAVGTGLIMNEIVVLSIDTILVVTGESEDESMVRKVFISGPRLSKVFRAPWVGAA
jgi:hypothetical protein